MTTDTELRDLFAAHAIAGSAIKEGASIAADTGHIERMAKKAYEIADAMILARAPADEATTT